MVPKIITVGNWKRHSRQSCIGATRLRPGHDSLTLAFCLATRRCMNLGPSFL